MFIENAVVAVVDLKVLIRLVELAALFSLAGVFV